MANAGNLDGKDICTGISNINGVAIDSLSKISGKDKKSCASCTALELARDSDACAGACRGECSEFYTNGTVGSLQLGDIIFTDSNCTVVAVDGFYSDVPCRGDQGLCFIQSRGQITGLDRC